jgi:hypothetical protein
MVSLVLIDIELFQEVTTEDHHTTVEVSDEELFPFLLPLVLAAALATTDTALFIATNMEELMDMEREFMVEDMFTGDVITDNDLRKTMAVIIGSTEKSFFNINLSYKSTNKSIILIKSLRSTVRSSR